jgi:hypothetical protein
MTGPVTDRVQLSRRPGWRKPEGAVVVSRPSRWGNPYQVTEAILDDSGLTEPQARARCVRLFRLWLDGEIPSAGPDMAARRTWILEHLHELRGKTLACWCPLPGDGQEDHCHARVLLELANAPEYGVRGFSDLMSRPVDIPMPENVARDCVRDCQLLGHQQPKTLIRRDLHGEWQEVGGDRD